MVRYLIHTKQLERASTIVDAVTVLNPRHRLAWELACACSEQLGDEPRLARARLVLEALDTDVSASPQLRLAS
jgi:hypothetical protein